MGYKYPDHVSPSTRYALPLLWATGISLRLTVLSVPPVLPAIHRDLHLSEALVGALTGLPVLLLAVFAVPGSLLIARIGARHALLAGLILLALAGALRGVSPSVPVLFGATIVMGAGVAVSQPALPALVRLWTPGRLALATAIYSNGFLVGEILAVALTASLVLPLAGGSWEIDLALWSVPVLLVAIAVVPMPGAAPTHENPTQWWPDWRDRRTWTLGLIFGCASASYFGANAFLPDYLKATHQAALITPALTALNVGQLPASFLVAGLAGRVIRRRLPLVAAGVLMVVAGLGFALNGPAIIPLAALLGFATALIFVLILALPPLLAPAHDVHRLSAAIFAITYTCPFVGSLLGGALWDLTGRPVMAFVVIAGAGVLALVLVRSLDFRTANQPLSAAEMAL